jgi:outer membrane receptor protein involved in Fe transport
VTSRFGFIDPDLGGKSSRYTVSGGLSWDEFEIDGYISYYDMRLFNNPTYFLNDPVNGDEFEQDDQRMIYGLTANYETQTQWGNMNVIPRLGFELRYDDVNELNLFNTVARQRIGFIRQDEAQELSLSFFGEAQIDVTDQLRATFGLRWDYYDYDIQAFLPANSGTGHDDLLQPKVGLAYSFNDSLEVYANYGIGFHSNDTRGSVISVDPLTMQPASPVDTLVEAEGAELGFRVDAFDGFRLTVAGFWMELESELLFVGDAGTSEPNDATRRIGVEADAFWEVNDWLVLDAAVTKTDGEFKGLPSGQNSIPDAHGFTASAGITIVTDNGWIGSLRMRHFGDAALVEDRSVTKASSTLLNLGISKNFGKYVIGLDVLNLLDSNEDDIDYFFESQLAGEPAPVEDIHFHPSEDRAFKLTLKYNF